MKIVFNDATELQVQKIDSSGDNIKIFIIGKTPEQLREIFSDPVRTEKVTVYERGQIVGVYEGYTSFQWTEIHTGGIYAVVMYRPDRAPVVQKEVQIAAVRVAQIQAQSMDDQQALQVKALYPAWEEIIGQTVKMGYKFLYEGFLYKVIQEELTIQEQYRPGQGTESIYERIDEVHVGTQDDPIPYAGNMVLESGKYYSQDGITYLCNRGTEIAVHQALKDLVGIYVETV